jgi:hypothetical protein
MFRYRTLTALLVCMLFTSVGLAQQPSTQPVIRTYNVSDLLRQTNDYPFDSKVEPPSVLGGRVAGGEGGGGGQSLFAGGVLVPQRKQPVTPIELDPLSQLIVDTVDSTSWQSNGGTVGRIKSISSVLVVTQTKENHDKIQSLLDEIRRTVGPAQIVTVHATWVLVAPNELNKIMTEATPEWMSKQKVYCESQLTCFSGQVVHISSGRGRQVTTDVTPIVGDGAVAFDPTVASVLSGVVLQISPQLVPGSDSAIVDVQTTASEWAEHESPITTNGAATSAPSSAQATASVDRVNMLSAEMKTTARVPLRKKMIVGGMTLDPSDADQGGRQLYLVLELDQPR